MAASPSLSLSDIMHPLSPPPTHILPRGSTPRSSTPEPLEPAEIEDMRRKVLAMGWVDSSSRKEKAGSREQELTDMLLRITHPAALPQPSQLHAQAETIAHLIQQRDFLVKRSIEEHERWESERESWGRAAHALIHQGRRESAHAEEEGGVASQCGLVATDASSQRLQEFERANSNLQNDKKVLQQKLTDTQSRLASLESELAQLKPLLLMQPFALTHSHPINPARGWAAVPTPSTPPSTRRGRDTRRAHDEVEAEDEPESDDAIPAPSIQPRIQFRNPISHTVTHDHPSLQPSFPISPQKTKGDYYRRREASASTLHHPSAQYSKPSRRKGSVPQSSPAKPILSDARTEHLLLAARKIGMQRASILSGAFAHVQPFPEPQLHARQKTQSSPSKSQNSPKTPRRNANANTPLLTRTPLVQTGISPAQSRTPLQSLLSAAQSVLSAPGDTSSSIVESPLAKRRKLDHPVTVTQSAQPPQGARKEQDRDKDKDKNVDREMEMALPGGVARVKSALDFLADQAEVYGTQPGSQDSAGDGESQFRDVAMLPGDVKMEHDSQPPAVGVSGDICNLDRDHVEGKTHTCEPTSTFKLRSPRIQSLGIAEGETQQTMIDNRSQGTTPSASLGAFSDPSTSYANGETILHQLPRAKQHTLTTSEVLAAPCMLAPAIDLTPPGSRPPAPLVSIADAPPDLRSRSGSPITAHSWPRALSAPAMETSPGSFSMFILQHPQPITQSGMGQSVAEPSSSSETVVQEQCSSVGVPPKLVEGIKFTEVPRRTRSPYTKWTKEEDDLLAKAVAKHGQKWDLVQKALPSRGYHQVRQRWLRKLGIFDSSKLDLSSLQTNAAAEFLNISTAPPTEDDDRRHSEPQEIANPKLGLAPLNSEKTLTVSSSNVDSLSPLATSGSVLVRSSSWPAGEHDGRGIGRK